MYVCIYIQNKKDFLLLYSYQQNEYIYLVALNLEKARKRNIFIKNIKYKLVDASTYNELERRKIIEHNIKSRQEITYLKNESL